MQDWSIPTQAWHKRTVQVLFSRNKTKTATAAHLALTMGFPSPFVTNARIRSTDSVEHLRFFIGVLLRCIPMDCQEGVSIAEISGGQTCHFLTQRLHTAEPTSLVVRPILQHISPPFDRWRHTNRSAYSMDDFYRTRRRLWLIIV